MTSPYTMRRIIQHINRYNSDDVLQYVYFQQKEAGIYDWYWNVSEACVQNGFKEVYDIGAAFGLQADVIMQNGLKYHGVEVNMHKHMFCPESVDYIPGTYPFKINAKRPSVCISHLCIGWNCYYPMEEDKIATFKQIADDFDAAILYIPNEVVPLCKPFFKAMRVIEMSEDLAGFHSETYLFSNLAEEDEE